jgi:hypothetical protein
MTTHFSKALQRTAVLLCAIAVFVASTHGAPGPAKVKWKPLSDSTMKLSGRAVKTWNLYQGDKKGRLFLIQLGQRVLLLDMQQHRVYEAPPNDFPAIAKGDEFEGPGILDVYRQIPTSNWSDRDIGPAQLIRVTLGDYGQTLELQVPHPIDLRAYY